MNILKKTDELARRIQSAPLLFAEFSSASCAPCAAIRQKLDRWAAAHPSASCVCIPVEDFPALAAEEGIFTVPTVLVYVQGRLTIRESGYFSLEDILARSERYLRLLSPDPDSPDP